MLLPFLILLQSEAGSVEQMATPGNPSGDTPRRRRRRIDDSNVHPSDHNPQALMEPSPRRRNPNLNGEVQYERPGPIQQQPKVPPEPYPPFRRLRDQQRTNSQPESPAMSSSSGTSQDGRSDFFDTAPPSDLDLRFPALSPQPSPLNSRRRGGSRQGREEAVVDSVANNSETGNSPDDGQAGQTLTNILAVDVPDVDVRWQSTKRLVENYMRDHRRTASHSSPDIPDREQSPERETARIARFRPMEDAQHSAGPIEIVDASNRAVFDRLDAVTSEVRALRQQVAELHAVLNLVVGGSGTQTNITRNAVQEGQAMDGMHLQEAESLDNIPSPVSSLWTTAHKMRNLTCCTAYCVIGH